MAKWFSEDPRTREWTQYDPSDTAALEKSFSTNQQNVVLDFAGSKFSVDVKKMIQTNNTGGSRKVRRDAPPKAAASVEKFVTGMTAQSDGILGMDQFTDFFGALGIDLGGAGPFILFHKFGVTGCWSATAEELKLGFASYNLEPNPSAVGAQLKKWTAELASDVNAFTAFHEFVFKFVRSNSSAKAVAFEDLKEPAKVCLDVFKKYTYTPGPVLDFLEAKNKPIPLDVWKMTLRFLVKIKPDFSNYSEDDMWPGLIDEFVEVQKAKR